ncbi:response regulator transcription factor [Streptosporangium sp. H16]|uniref:response regulator transcription factor n=1 Tax=Streptosporangium sp. H16 TaxID=3444184 RepID=UPI003F79D8B0
MACFCHLTEHDTAEHERHLDDALRSVGETNAEIAAELFLSPGTVENHIAGIQRKLGVRNRVGIASWAWSTGRTRAWPHRG